MTDDTEDLRRLLQAKVNAEAAGREALEARYGQVWSTDQMCADFEAIGFLAPFIVVRRKADGVRGSLMFQHGPPRYYFGWQEDRR